MEKLHAVITAARGPISPSVSAPYFSLLIQLDTGPLSFIQPKRLLYAEAEGQLCAQDVTRSSRRTSDGCVIRGPGHKSWLIPASCKQQCDCSRLLGGLSDL